MTEPEIDTAIDRAVRDLMSVDTDAAFRARVTARLERPERRSGRGSLLTALAMAAALVVGMLWMRSTPAVPKESTPVARVEAPAPSAQPGTAPTRLRPSPATPAAVSAGRRGDNRHPAVSIPRGVVTASVAAPTSPIPPLEALEPISIAAIAQRPIAPAAIDVAPLPSIADVQISPLEPPSARH